MYMRVSLNDSDSKDDVRVVVPTTETEERKNYWHVDPWALVLQKLKIETTKNRAWIMKRGRILVNGKFAEVTEERKTKFGDQFLGF